MATIVTQETKDKVELHCDCGCDCGGALVPYDPGMSSADARYSHQAIKVGGKDWCVNCLMEKAGLAERLIHVPQVL